MQILLKLVGLLICFFFSMDNAFSDMEISAGERLYVQCTGCHAPDYNRTGPKHCGILGSVAGSVKNFTYTKAMANSKIVWTRETLDQFLVSPLKMVPGTSMGFVGISSAKQRQQLVSYLSQLNEKNTICK